MSTLFFNHHPSHMMHIDLNSCFASIEQQANPLLRGKPVAVAAFTSPRGCILAASVEAKRMGIKTGMRVRDGKDVYNQLIVLPSDPPKYRDIHLRLRKLISEYTSDFTPKSIDEFILNMNDYLFLKRSLSLDQYSGVMADVAKEIKRRIKNEIGEWLTVSIGIAPNRYLAKIAAGLNKPDGLDEINAKNFIKTYSKLKLTDLTGIKERNAIRLNSMGIFSVLDFYEAPVWRLKAAFKSITGLYWHIRLTGYEVDNVEFGRRSYGNSVAIGKDLSSVESLSPVIARLAEKTCSRLRRAGYKARGVHLGIVYKNGLFWHKGSTLAESIFDTRDIYGHLFRLFLMSPSATRGTPVLNLAVSVFSLTRDKPLQTNLFENAEKKVRLVKTIDTINQRWGDFTLGIARGYKGEGVVLDRIAFGGIKELEETI